MPKNILEGIPAGVFGRTPERITGKVFSQIPVEILESTCGGISEEITRIPAGNAEEITSGNFEKVPRGKPRSNI